LEWRLLTEFRSLFEGKKYIHRSSNLGDQVACCLFEDLLSVGRSARLAERISRQLAVANTRNLTVGRSVRRGDGTFGEAVPGVEVFLVPNFTVPRGQIASIEIGAETKILAKAMIKQIDRVVSDLRAQADHFRSAGAEPICVGLVGVNHADAYVSFEGRRKFPTDGKKHKHPVQEAAEATSRLLEKASPAFSEFLVLKYRATNAKPFPFEWVDEQATRVEYAAMLARICAMYDRRR
jgi:hypothetical protein